MMPLLPHDCGCMSSGMKPAKRTSRSKAVKDYERRQKTCYEGSSSACRGSTPMPAADAQDRIVKRKHCALDFDTLDCPICLEPHLPPVYQCQNGHTACAACCARLEKASCPSCSLPIGTNRCIALEKIIESLQVSCKYGEWGCKEMRQYSSKRFEHEYHCKFRPYQCPAVGCDYKGLQPGLLEHFLLIHNVEEVPQHSLDEERSFDFTYSTEDGAYDISRSQYDVLQVFELDDGGLDDIPDYDPDQGSLYLLRHQYQEKFCRYSFSCTSFGDGNWLKRCHISVNSTTAGDLLNRYSVEGPIYNNQTDPAVLSKIVQQGECLLVPRVHPAQKDFLQFDLRITLLHDDQRYYSDG